MEKVVSEKFSSYNVIQLPDVTSTLKNFKQLNAVGCGNAGKYICFAGVRRVYKKYSQDFRVGTTLDLELH
jgi:hypothetical protein